MRRLACLVWGLSLVLAACGTTEPAAEAPSATSTTAAPTTGPTTTATTTTSTTTTTLPNETTTTTTQPEETTTTLQAVRDLEAGLFCRDLEAMGYTYEDAMHYWVLEGETDRMDADRNGIPCETVWPGYVVKAYWGDPLPTTTTTKAPSGPFLVIEPTYDPPSEPGAGDLYGSGCSPGTTSLPDGVWFGRIEAMSIRSIEFDLMCFGPGPEGPGTITNSNPKLRTVDVHPAGSVFATSPDGDWMWMSWGEWFGSPQNARAFCPPDGCWDVWLYVNDGAITEIVQLWFP